MNNSPILVFFYMISSFVIHGQNCEITDELLVHYEKDVKHLVLLRMEQFNAPELEAIEISEIWQDSIWEGLAAIYNSESNERDQVFDQYCIHQNSWNSSNFNRISNSILVELDTSASWFQNWENGIITTSDLFLDSLFSHHGFDSVRFSIPSFNVFSLYTDEYLNLEALVEAIEPNENFVYVERETGGGDYSKITYDYIGEEKFFDFTIGWGDCPSGCTSNQTWSFKADQLCNVTFLGIQANEGIPEPINCNISTSIENIFSDSKYIISPNPFVDRISINGITNYFFKKYILLNVNGIKILDGNFINNEIRNLNLINPGIYFLIVETDRNERSVHRIVKIK